MLQLQPTKLNSKKYLEFSFNGCNCNIAPFFNIYAGEIIKIEFKMSFNDILNRNPPVLVKGYFRFLLARSNCIFTRDLVNFGYSNFQAHFWWFFWSSLHGQKIQDFSCFSRSKNTARHDPQNQSFQCFPFFSHKNSILCFPCSCKNNH